MHVRRDPDQCDETADSTTQSDMLKKLITENGGSLSNYGMHVSFATDYIPEVLWSYKLTHNMPIQFNTSASLTTSTEVIPPIPDIWRKLADSQIVKLYGRLPFVINMFSSSPRVIKKVDSYFEFYGKMLQRCNVSVDFVLRAYNPDIPKYTDDTLLADWQKQTFEWAAVNLIRWSKMVPDSRILIENLPGPSSGMDMSSVWALYLGFFDQKEGNLRDRINRFGLAVNMQHAWASGPVYDVNHFMDGIVPSPVKLVYVNAAPDNVEQFSHISLNSYTSIAQSMERNKMWAKRDGYVSVFNNQRFSIDSIIKFLIDRNIPAIIDRANYSLIYSELMWLVSMTGEVYK